jgi:CubicO group peptidase (beta-lactamase class C family)
MGIAISEGHLGLNQTMGQLLPAYRSSMSRPETGITVRQLLTMTAGFPENSTGASKGAFMGSPNWVDFILSYGLDHPPGTAFAYSDPSAHLLAAILTRATGQPLLAYARRHLFDPLGIDTRPAFTPQAVSGDSLVALDRYTSASSGFAWPTDPQGTYLGFMGIKLTPTDLAKLGELYLHHGRANGHQVVPTSWVRQATSPQITGDAGTGYGYLWWTFTYRGHPFFDAIGSAGQYVIVVPYLNLVVVIASDVDGGTANPVTNPELSDEILKVVIPALKR